MPDRIIRDELLNSERYWAVSMEAQRLFVHLMLCVDDTARYSGKNFTIRSACFPGQAVEPSKLEKQLLELVDVDLVRIYYVGDERFIFIPRFRQRLRFTKSKYPPPPQEINDIPSEKSDLSLTQVSPKPDSSRQKRREVKRSEEKRSKAEARASRLPSNWSPSEEVLAWSSKTRPELVMSTVVEEFRDYWLAEGGQKARKVDWELAFRNWVRRQRAVAVPPKSGAGAWWTSEEATLAKAKELGMVAQGGEDWNSFRKRIADRIRAAA